MIKPQHLLKIVLTLFAFCVVTVATMSAQSLTTLVQFNNSDGSLPESSLLQGPAGNFFGTTSADGTNNSGTLFRMTPAGKLNVLYSFCSLTDCDDGVQPDNCCWLVTEIFMGTRGRAGQIATNSLTSAVARSSNSRRRKPWSHSTAFASSRTAPTDGTPTL